MTTILIIIAALAILELGGLAVGLALCWMAKDA